MRLHNNIKDKHSYDFAEYGYLFDESSNELSVYNYGKLIYRFNPSDEEAFRRAGFIFKKSYELEEVLCYNEEKLSYDFSQPIAELTKDFTLDELRDIAERVREPRIELDDRHLLLYAGSSVYAYGKRVRISDNSRDSAMFVCEKHTSRNAKWDVLIRLPYLKCTLSTGFASEDKAVQYIRNLVKDIGTAKMGKYIELSGRILSYYKDNRYYDMRRLLEGLDDEWRKQEWPDFNGAFSVDTIRKHYRFLWC